MIALTHSNDWLSIGKLSAKYGISQPTIRTMCERGLPYALTCGQHRRINEAEFRRFIGLDQEAATSLPRICIVCRVSTPAQAKPRTDGPDAKSDLDRQVERCRAYVRDRWGDACICEENIRITSGLNFNHPKIIEFTLNLVQKKYDYVVISYKDRLARSSFDLWVNLAKHAGTEIIMVEEKDDPTFTESLVEDLIALCTVAACKHNSAKAAKNSTINVDQDSIVKLYEMKMQGMSYADLAKWAEGQGIKGEKGEKLSSAKVHQLLSKHHAVLDKLCPQTSSHVDEFIKEHLKPLEAYQATRRNQNDMVRQMDVYEQYTKWCGKKGVAPVSQKKLGAAMSKAGFEWTRAKQGCKCWWCVLRTV